MDPNPRTPGNRSQIRILVNNTDPDLQHCLERIAGHGECYSSPQTAKYGNGAMENCPRSGRAWSNSKFSSSCPCTPLKTIFWALNYETRQLFKILAQNSFTAHSLGIQVATWPARPWYSHCPLPTVQSTYLGQQVTVRPALPQYRHCTLPTVQSTYLGRDVTASPAIPRYRH
jgi:hypothetical protein